MDGTHPSSGVARVSVGCDGDGAGSVPALCQAQCPMGDTLGSASLFELLIPQGLGPGTPG